MIKYRILLLALYGCLGLFGSCNTDTPENDFDIAVLNCNMLGGFANEGLSRQLESPSMKLVEGTKDQSAPMKRKEVIDTKIKFLEENYAKLKNLKITDDNKEILQTSLALNGYVLPVYKKEYVQLAELYDKGAPKAEINTLTQQIHDSYFTNFEKQFNSLIAAGKLYALKHHINVKWPD